MCIRDSKYAMAPHSGTWESAQSFRNAYQHAAPLLARQINNTVKHLPHSGGFIAVSPAELLLSSLKKAEHNESLIIRLFNISKREISGKIQFYHEIESARLVNLNEQPISETDLLVEQGHSISLKIEPAKIVNLELFLAKEKVDGTFNPPAYKIVDLK